MSTSCSVSVCEFEVIIVMLMLLFIRDGVTLNCLSLPWVRKSQNSWIWDFEISVKFIILRCVHPRTNATRTCLHFPLVLQALPAASGFVLQWHVSSCTTQPAMKLGSLSKVASLALIVAYVYLLVRSVFWHVDKRNTPLRCWVEF